MKFLLLTLILFTHLLSETKFCFIKDYTSQTLSNDVKLDGTLCNGKKSIQDLKNESWKVDEHKVFEKDGKYTHMVIFSKTIEKQPIKFVEKFDLSLKKGKISSVSNDIITIDLTNLKAGQSGVIVHKNGTNNVIIAKAIVTNSTNTNSSLKIVQDGTIKQDALPTTALKVTVGDEFILNHLYTTSVMIVPNIKAKKEILKQYDTINFLDEDILASYLKIEESPLPTKEDIESFCKKNQVGTIFLVVRNTLFIIDSLSFEVLHVQYLEVNDSLTTVPFLTKIEDIKKSFWSFSDDKIKNYDEYYLKLIGIKNAR